MRQYFEMLRFFIFEYELEINTALNLILFHSTAFFIFLAYGQADSVLGASFLGICVCTLVYVWLCYFSDRKPMVYFYRKSMCLVKDDIVFFRVAEAVFCGSIVAIKQDKAVLIDLNDQLLTQSIDALHWYPPS